MNQPILSKIIKGRRVTLPTDMCNVLNLKEGDFVVFELDSLNNEIKISPAQIVKRGIKKQDVTSHEIKRHVCAEDCKGELNLAAFEGIENDPDYQYIKDAETNIFKNMRTMGDGDRITHIENVVWDEQQGKFVEKK